MEELEVFPYKGRKTFIF